MIYVPVGAEGLAYATRFFGMGNNIAYWHGFVPQSSWKCVKSFLIQLDSSITILNVVLLITKYYIVSSFVIKINVEMLVWLFWVRFVDYFCWCYVCVFLFIWINLNIILNPWIFFLFFSFFGFAKLDILFWCWILISDAHAYSWNLGWQD